MSRPLKKVSDSPVSLETFFFSNEVIQTVTEYVKNPCEANLRKIPQWFRQNRFRKKLRKKYTIDEDGCLKNVDKLMIPYSPELPKAIHTREDGQCRSLNAMERDFLAPYFLLNKSGLVMEIANQCEYGCIDRSLGDKISQGMVKISQGMAKQRLLKEKKEHLEILLEKLGVRLVEKLDIEKKEFEIVGNDFDPAHLRVKPRSFVLDGIYYDQIVALTKWWETRTPMHTERPSWWKMNEDGPGITIGFRFGYASPDLFRTCRKIILIYEPKKGPGAVQGWPAGFDRRLTLSFNFALQWLF